MLFWYGPLAMTPIAQTIRHFPAGLAATARIQFLHIIGKAIHLDGYPRRLETWAPSRLIHVFCVRSLSSVSNHQSSEDLPFQKPSSTGPPNAGLPGLVGTDLHTVPRLSQVSESPYVSVGIGADHLLGCVPPRAVRVGWRSKGQPCSRTCTGTKRRTPPAHSAGPWNFCSLCCVDQIRREAGSSGCVGKLAIQSHTFVPSNGARQAVFQASLPRAGQPIGSPIITDLREGSEQRLCDCLAGLTLWHDLTADSFSQSCRVALHCCLSGPLSGTNLLPDVCRSVAWGEFGWRLLGALLPAPLP